MPETNDALLRRVRSEYVEMPGLSLTDAQAARLWQVTEDEARRLLRGLVEARFLMRSGRGHYCRMSAG